MAQENKDNKSDPDNLLLRRKAKEILEESRRTVLEGKKREANVANGKRRGEPAGQTGEPPQRRGASRRLQERRQEVNMKKQGGPPEVLPPNPSRRENQLQELLSKNLSCSNLLIN